MSETKLANPFVGQYERELSRMANRISSYTPEYIVAITRSGPRLLELLIEEGIFSTEATIITEKSLDFMPKDSLEGSSAVIFDDVVNTGKTIYSVQDKVQRYDFKHVNTVSFGYDIDTGQVTTESVEPQLELSISKRYEITKNITQSFSYLNKPYDVDHPIFYSDIDKKTINSFENNSKTYDISTVTETSSGHSKYTLFPEENGGIKNLLADLIDVEEYKIDIEKARAYYDSSTKSFALVPITSFPIYTERVKDVDIFSESAPDVYNNIMKAAKRQIDAIETNFQQTNEGMLLYRLLWYLVNHAYGVGYQIQYNDILPQRKSAKESLKSDDLRYLFGDSLTELILSGLERDDREIKEYIKKTINEDSSTETEIIIKNRNSRDKQQSELYEHLRPYVKNNVSNKMTYSDQLSSIFEGTQLEIESETEKNLDNVRDVETPHTARDVSQRFERKTGLNVSQMKSLLKESGIEFSEESDRGYSLALDFLVDTGVAIPMFYHAYSKSSEKSYLERTYRHGEGALNRMGYSYLVDSVIEELTEYAEEDINRIALEKIGVMVTDRLHNGRYWGQATTKSIYDFLSGDSLARELDIAPEYYRHGKVVLIEDQPEHETNFFTDWCEEQNIISSNDQGVRRGSGWKHEHKSDIDQVESTISDAQVAALESLATLLYDIDQNVDDGSNDYLTALTTCRDRRSYVKAVHAAIELFFVNKKWKIEESINQASNICERVKHMDSNAFVDRDLSDISNDLKAAREKSDNAHQAINEVTNKKRLRRKFKESQIITDVREYFENHPSRHYRKTYEQNLEPFLDHLDEVTELQGPEAEVFEDKTELFGELCIYLSDVYRITLQVAQKVAEGKTDLRSDMAGLYESIRTFNDAIETHSDAFYDGILISEVPKIKLDDVRIESIQQSEFNKEDFKDRNASIILIQDLLSQVLSSYNKLDDIYCNYFERGPWKRKLEDIFHEETTIEANWVVWYDIKDSSNPKNQDQSDILKERLNEELDVLSEELDDGEFKKSDDDEKHIFIRENENVAKYLRKILDLASRQSMFMRMSVCSVPSGDLKPSQYGHVEGNEAHVRAVRVGDYLNKHGEEEDGYHYLSLTTGAMDRLYEDYNLPEIVTKKYESVDTLDETVSTKDPDIGIDFKVFILESN